MAFLEDQKWYHLARRRLLGEIPQDPRMGQEAEAKSENGLSEGKAKEV